MAPEIFRLGTLRVLSWNIAGVRNKLTDAGWLSMMTNFDIICLQEAWNVKGCLHLDGFTSYTVPATRSASGHASGGLTTLVNLGLSCKVVVLKSNLKTILGILLSFANTCRLLLINFYNAVLLKNELDAVTSLKAFIVDFYQSEPPFTVILLAGDFNLHPCYSCPMNNDSDSEHLIIDQVHFKHTCQGDFANSLISELNLINLMDPNQENSFERIPTFVGGTVL